MNGSLLLLGFLTLQRMAELAWSARNMSRLVAAGGIEFGRSHYPAMVALHGAWLIGLWLLAYGRPIDPLYLGAFVLLQVGRLSVLASLGCRWTTRVVVIPGAPLVTTGIYRPLRHPNYLIVMGEIVVVPLALGLPVFAAVFFVLNSLMLMLRIGVENAALAWASGQSAELSQVSMKSAAQSNK